MMLLARSPRRFRMVLLLSVMLSSAAFAAGVEDAIQSEAKLNRNAAQTQQKVDAFVDETRQLQAEYRAILAQIDNLTTYNEQLQQVVTSQEEEKQSIRDQLTHLEETNQGVVPLMVDMIDMLGKMVEADLPFRLAERRERVADLRDLLGRADVTVSEKYRRVIEAYQVEMNYGRSTEAYQDTLPGESRTVEFLRIGRTLLLYQTLGGDETGWYRRDTGAFEELPRDYEREVANGLKMAKQQAAPALIRLPVNAPGAVQ